MTDDLPHLQPQLGRGQRGGPASSQLVRAKAKLEVLGPSLPVKEVIGAVVKGRLLSDICQKILILQ